MQDGLTDAEVSLLGAVRWSGAADSVEGTASVTRLLTALVGEPWVQDGLTETERLLLGDIEWLTGYENETTAVSMVGALLDTPWIRDGLTDREGDILWSLHLLLSGDDVTMAHQAVRLVTQAAWIQDSLEEPEYWMLGRILRGAGVSLALRTIDDPAFSVAAEERTINLPYSGPVTLVIIREGQGAPRSMDDLEYAVRGVEALVSEPLPTEILRILSDPFEGRAAHFGRFISMPARTEGSDWFAGAIIHEVGHYYFGSRWPWISEGAAGIIEDIVHYPRTGRAIDANNYPCVHTTTIAEFETSGSYDCSYAFGKRIFADLYHTLGPELFGMGFRNLYRNVSSRTGDDIDGFRAAFKDAAPGQAQAIDVIVDRWYSGPPPRGVLPRDTQPVTPYIEGSDVMIETAEIVLPDGTPVSVLSKQGDIGAPVLMLRFTFANRSHPRNITLDIVGYFEDGFAFYRDKLRFVLSPGSTRHTEVISLNPPAQSFGRAPGQYWVFVYHGDRKTAEASFSVDG